jgi:enamine deaminase RidA (YjgF/YER057c/UK114 family)
MKRTLFNSGAKWEDIVGYSRAVRHGNIIEVSGSTSIEDGKLVGKGDIGLQTLTTLNIIKKSITALGGEMKDVIRTRIYVTDISLWEEVGKVHGEFFGDIKPATSMIQISALIDPDMLVEIEVTAIVDQ